jgi:hypothetical protein
MSCSGHADGTTSACCSRCAKPGCPGCLEQVDDSFFCTDCLLEKLESAEAEAYTREAEAEAQTETLQARARIKRNWILTGVISLIAVPGLIGAIVEDPTVPSGLKPFAIPVVGAAGAYLAWAALWGIPAAWRWWKGLFDGVGAFILATPFGWLLLLVTFFTIPLYFGYLYGVFGGAIYEYRKTRKVAAAPS